MTLKDLLVMTSGLDCNYGSVNKWAGTITMRKSNDWTQYNLNPDTASPRYADNFPHTKRPYTKCGIRPYSHLNQTQIESLKLL